MPQFTIRVRATNNSGFAVKVHIGASDHVEYFNTSEDYKHTFPIGRSTITRYLTTGLGAYQKYYL